MSRRTPICRAEGRSRFEAGMLSPLTATLSRRWPTDCVTESVVGWSKFETRGFGNRARAAVALNCGTGLSSLNALLNAFERLHIVRGENSSYCGYA